MTYDRENEDHRARNREYQRRWYSKNREKQIVRAIKNNKRRTKEIKKYLFEIKSSGCSLCEEKEPCCIDFHHRNPKEKLFNINEGIKRYSFDKIKDEISKCDLLCANCHRKFHLSS